MLSDRGNLACASQEEVQKSLCVSCFEKDSWEEQFQHRCNSLCHYRKLGQGTKWVSFLWERGQVVVITLKKRCRSRRVACQIHNSICQPASSSVCLPHNPQKIDKLQFQCKILLWAVNISSSGCWKTLSFSPLFRVFIIFLCCFIYVTRIWKDAFYCISIKTVFLVDRELHHTAFTLTPCTD